MTPLQGAVRSHALVLHLTLQQGLMQCSLLRVAVLSACPQAVPTKDSGRDPAGLLCRCLPLIYPAVPGNRAHLCSPAEADH